MRHVMSPLDFSVEELDQIFNLANDIEQHMDKYAHACAGKKLATCFYEPSTRTRLSFESAMLNLGGSVLRIFRCQLLFRYERRKRCRYHPCHLLLCRHLCHASPQGRSPDGCGSPLFHSGYQCR